MGVRLVQKQLVTMDHICNHWLTPAAASAKRSPISPELYTGVPILNKHLMFLSSYIFTSTCEWGQTVDDRGPQEPQQGAQRSFVQKTIYKWYSTAQIYPTCHCQSHLHHDLGNLVYNPSWVHNGWGQEGLAIIPLFMIIWKDAIFSTQSLQTRA